MRFASTHTLPLYRAIFAALLTLALLSGSIPFSALSASHSCSMPCCAGAEGGCATGACTGALLTSPKKIEEEKLCGAEEEGESKGGTHKAHAAIPAAETEESHHCDSDRKGATSDKTASTETQPSKASNEKQNGFITISTLAAPCSRDCCAVVNTSTQSRRGRESPLLPASMGAPPHAFISFSLYSPTLRAIASRYLKGLRGRAPPSLSSNSLA